MKQSLRHKLQERFDCITTKLQSEPITPDDTKDMETLNVQKIEVQTGGKLRCGKIRKPALAFSPPIRNLDLQRLAYINLCKWHKGDKLTNKHVFREAIRHGIDHPKELTAGQCAQGATACQKLLKEHKEDAEGLRQEHLQNRYELASDLKDPVKLPGIKEITKREEQRNKWRRIKQVTGDSCQILYSAKKVKDH
jgi:hypothetical protein